MTKPFAFTHSDLIAGYVVGFDPSADAFELETSDGRRFAAGLTPNTFAEIVRNLGEPYRDATGDMRARLVPGRYVYAYGVFYPDGADDAPRFEAKHLVFAGDETAEFVFERGDWWQAQIRQLGDFYLKAEFPDGVIDFRNYRTNLTDVGEHAGDGRQETDTISRLVYGFASAYLLTGEDRFLEAAEAGTRYLRENLRGEDRETGVVWWHHALDLKADGGRQTLLASVFGDDYDAIPCYEQIYALAGPVQTFRITGDPAILADAEGTIALFDRHFRDKSEAGGYFSHVDPVTFDPTAPSLGHNRARKNWNSVGDHAPAYLINLWLATGRQEFRDFLEYTFDTIALRFPDYEHSPFVQEKFFADWSRDQSWGWQQNRAVVGHNLKIAWNLIRMHSLAPKPAYRDLAEKIAALMPEAGSDRQRGGWYDVVERTLAPGQRFHRFAWHDRKAWWQQEQAILAYLILRGVTREPDHLKHARESAAFYNAWFLDREAGGVYFNVLANGLPYALGTERGKGSHSMAGYHSFELCYLAAVYTNLLIAGKPLDLHFKPQPGAFPDGVLRVSPDILPKGSVRIASVRIDGAPHADFDPIGLTVKLPAADRPIAVKVRLMAAAEAFSAELVSVTDDRARIALSGRLGPRALPLLDEALAAADAAGARSVVFDTAGLDAIAQEALRFLLLAKQHRGPDFGLGFAGATGAVADALADSEILGEATPV